ncbi:MAG: hypothetical protein Q7T03_07780 [Deltaproteobacteria bacterium]|nr:hypothetical protein [Deltaproteobacteria bacterium]
MGIDLLAPLSGSLLLANTTLPQVTSIALQNAVAETAGENSFLKTVPTGFLIGQRRFEPPSIVMAHVLSNLVIQRDFLVASAPPATPPAGRRNETSTDASTGIYVNYEAFFEETLDLASKITTELLLKVRLAHLKEIGRRIRKLKPENRLVIVEAVEHVLRYGSVSMRKHALGVLRQSLPFIEEKERLAKVESISLSLSDEDGRKTAFQCLQKMDKLLPKNALTQWIIFIYRLYNGDYYALKLFKAYEPLLEPDPARQAELLLFLSQKNLSEAQIEEGIVNLTYAYGRDLTLGAKRLFIMQGNRVMQGQESRLIRLAEDNGEIGYQTRGERLQSLAEELIALEREGNFDMTACLYDTEKVDGKAHGFATGYSSGVDFNNPVSLWPMSSPRHLAEMAAELLQTSTSIKPQYVRLSLIVQGEADEALKPIALAVHSLLQLPYPFPAQVTFSKALNWCALVVPNLIGGQQKYEYRFLKFHSPPRPEYFELPEGKLGEWDTKRRKFLKEQRPEFLGADPRDHSINVRLQLGDRRDIFIWYPSQSDWLAITEPPKRGNISIVGAKHSQREFETRLFLEFERTYFLEKVESLAETVWALGMLKSYAKEHKEMARLLREFSGRFEWLLRKKRLASILQTKWVGNPNWKAILSDLHRYQYTLLANPQWRDEIGNLIRTTLRKMDEILATV